MAVTANTNKQHQQDQQQLTAEELVDGEPCRRQSLPLFVGGQMLIPDQILFRLPRVVFGRKTGPSHLKIMYIKSEFPRH